MESISIAVDMADSSNTYSVDVVTTPGGGGEATIATLSLAATNRTAYNTALSGAIAAGNEIGVKLTRTAGSGVSAFTYATVTVESK